METARLAVAEIYAQDETTDCALWSRSGRAFRARGLLEPLLVPDLALLIHEPASGARWLVVVQKDLPPVGNWHERGHPADWRMHAVLESADPSGSNVLLRIRPGDYPIVDLRGPEDL